MQDFIYMYVLVQRFYVSIYTYIKLIITIYSWILNIKIIFDDELKSNKERVLDEVFNWLGVEPINSRVQGTRSNVGVYSIKRLKFINLRNPLVFKYNENRTKYYRKAYLGPIFNALIIGFDRLVLSRFFSNKKPSMREEDRNRLIEYYYPDMCALENLLGKDLRAWYE